MWTHHQETLCENLTIAANKKCTKNEHILMMYRVPLNQSIQIQSIWHHITVHFTVNIFIYVKWQMAVSNRFSFLHIELSWWVINDDWTEFVWIEHEWEWRCVRMKSNKNEIDSILLELIKLNVKQIRWNWILQIKKKKIAC